MMMYQAFWGKAQSDEAGAPRMHPLAAHSLDVAAVAVTLGLPANYGMDPNTLAFLVALHDIGKFSRPFQGKVPAHWPQAALGPFPGAGVPAGPRHDAVGGAVMSRTLDETLNRIFPPRIAGRGWPRASRGRILAALAGHHGRPAPTLDGPLPTNIVCYGCLAAISEFVAALLVLFDPAPFPLPADEKDVTRLTWHLAGLTTVADWIGSRQAWFPYATCDDIADYWRAHALPQATAAVRSAGLAALQPAPYAGLRALFPAIVTPSPVQRWAETIDLPTGPVLAVIEDLTGSGKTEAAITLAHRLIADGRAQGVFMGLPTMATANAMFGRLSRSYRGLFDPATNPSLALAHGRAGLNQDFAAAIAPDPTLPSQPTSTDPADDPAEAHCAAWLAEDRRRSLLAQIGVGTLDQALLAALPVRQAPLRLWGLAGKVLIIDEAHAFDAYMQREMIALLRFHAALGGSAILLSATLPRAVRQGLADAFRNGLGHGPAPLTSAAYPLATLIGRDGLSETPCAVRDGLARRVTVTRLDCPDAAIDRIVAASTLGAAIAWVRNTVDDAIAATEALLARGVNALLFHARFAMSDRLAIEAEVLRRFGPSGTAADRCGVLVATQVIEQSLDLDFDLLCTDIAPADLLIQRAGRLWRHKRDARPMGIPELLIVSPDAVEQPDANWLRATMPGTAAVYADPALVWRSARDIFHRGAIVTPDDMRPMIEFAFDSMADHAVPPGLATATGRAEGKVMGQQAIAEQNVLNVWDGYLPGMGLWDTDLRTPTRLEDQPQVTLRLAIVRDGEVVPYADDPDVGRAWSLSEIRVAQRRITFCPPPDGLQAAIETARAQWGRWEREADTVLCAVLQPADGGWLLECRDGSGRHVTVGYKSIVGLSFSLVIY